MDINITQRIVRNFIIFSALFLSLPLYFYCGSKQSTKWHYIMQTFYLPSWLKGKKGPPKNFTGIWYKWYRNGDLYKEAGYKDGQKYGRHLYFGKLKKVELFSLFKNNVPIGEWIYYDENGLIDKTDVYQEGVLRKSFSNYDTSGYCQKCLNYDSNYYLISEVTYKLGKEVSKKDFKPN
ncbi:MAG: hypothetical protein COA79_03630 [Planctomycetota bacterium]|nr:MAG: hypothetical protein COA79_03630 [Planctomycetota bacterium]